MAVICMLGVVLFCLSAVTSQAPSCQRINLLATKSAKNLTSPGFPSDYSNNLDYCWSIQAETVKWKVKVNFTIFNVQTSSTACIEDYLTIYDGDSIDSQKLTTSCGTNISSPIFCSVGSFLFLHLHTNGINTAQGFFLTYEEVPYTELVVTESPPLLTPKPYPICYGRSAACFWLIRARDQRHSISIEVTNSHLENSANCSRAYVQIYDGNSTSAPVLKRWCGSEKPQVTGTSPELLVKFHSESNNSNENYFYLNYKQVNLTRCGNRNLVAWDYSMDLKSPGYPFGYSASLPCCGRKLDCLWRVTTQRPDAVVKLEVLDVKLEESVFRTCSYDYVEVYDGSAKTGRLMGKFCNNSKQIFYTTTRTLEVVFHSDHSGHDKGFKLRYTQVILESCNGKQTLQSSSFQKFLSSPNYPRGDRLLYSCGWTLSTLSKQEKIAIEFVSLDISASCEHEFLKIFDGPDTRSPSLFTSCKDKIPSVGLISSGSRVLIEYNHFRQNVLPSKGFRLKYYTYKSESTDCKQDEVVEVDVGETPVYVTSPNFLNSYESIQCRWQFKTVDTGHRIRLTIQRSSPIIHCGSHPLSVYDGPDSSSGLLGAFCERGSPSYYSSSNQLFVDFISTYATRIQSFELKLETFPESSSVPKTTTTSSESKGSGSSTSAVVGVVVGCLFLLLIAAAVVAIMCYVNRQRRARQRQHRPHPGHWQPGVCNISGSLTSAGSIPRNEQQPVAYFSGALYVPNREIASAIGTDDVHPELSFVNALATLPPYPGRGHTQDLDPPPYSSLTQDNESKDNTSSTEATGSSQPRLTESSSPSTAPTALPSFPPPPYSLVPESVDNAHALDSEATPTQELLPEPPAPPYTQSSDHVYDNPGGPQDVRETEIDR